MSSPTPNREVDEVRNSEKLVLHDDTEHCMLVLAVLGNEKNFSFLKVKFFGCPELPVPACNALLSS